MKLDSKLFDIVRIRPRRAEAQRTSVPRCGWEGCDRDGLYRAPKGHRAVGEYHHFCLEHVRHYNAAFNFFAEMDTDQVEAFLNGRPDEQLNFGRTQWNRRKAHPSDPKPRYAPRFNDPLNLFARLA